MHDLDHTRPAHDYETDRDEEFEFEFADDEFEFEMEYETDDADLFSEAEVNELAAELVSASGDDEMEYFLGSLVKKAASRAYKLGKAAAGEARRFAGSSQGRALVGHAKSAARGLLKKAGGSLGGYAGSRSGYGAGRGGRAGTDFGDWVADKVGLELEGVGHEFEFEAAKRLVRVTAAATTNALTQPAKGSPMAASRRALSSAVRQTSGASRGRQRQGRWMRRGSSIVLYGV